MGAAVGQVYSYDAAWNENRFFRSLDRDLRWQYQTLFGHGYDAGIYLRQGVQQPAALDKTARAQGNTQVKRVGGLVAGVVGEPTPDIHAAQPGE